MTAKNAEKASNRTMSEQAQFRTDILGQNFKEIAAELTATTGYCHKQTKRSSLMANCIRVVKVNSTSPSRKLGLSVR